MHDELSKLLDRHKQRPWPRLAAEVGDFALYESLLVGIAATVLKGDRIRTDEVPVPDHDTLAHVETLKAARELSDDQTEFLRYFKSIENVRKTLLLHNEAIPLGKTTSGE